MKRLAAAAAMIAIAGCGRYADFRLPAPEGSVADLRFEWQADKDPVMPRGATWDSVDVLNPSVVRLDGGYANFYSGFDGKTWHTGFAASIDGRNWTVRTQVMSPQATWEGRYIAANGSALKDGETIRYWYEAGAPVLKIGLAEMRPDRNARGAQPTWKKPPAPVLEPGPSGSWDERGVADPYVIRAGDSYYLFYLGQDRARRQRLGMARSQDGVVWTKLRSNPILELGGAGQFDEGGLGEPAVWTSHGRWWMLYTGRDREEIRRIGLASSLDGANWRRVEGFPIFAGTEPWNAKVVCDPSVEPFDGGVRVWFGGGDVAHPAENIHGQIGFAILRMIPR
ncbi:MAG: hypothetical protein ABI823_11405 [Bryobacteraceae bacterium]